MYLVENVTALLELIFSKKSRFALIVGRSGAISSASFNFFLVVKVGIFIDYLACLLNGLQVLFDLKTGLVTRVSQNRYFQVFQVYLTH